MPQPTSKCSYCDSPAYLNEGVSKKTGNPYKMIKCVAVETHIDWINDPPKPQKPPSIKRSASGGVLPSTRKPEILPDDVLLKAIYDDVQIIKGIVQRELPEEINENLQEAEEQE